MIIREQNRTGVRRKRVEKGLEVAGWRSKRICVKPQRKPEKNADAMTSVKPSALKAASPATIITTPIVIVAMINFMEGDSRRKRNANSKTKARADDLHMVRNVREINLRDMFPRPTSSEVAAPHGTRRVK
jgi:peptidase E